MEHIVHSSLHHGLIHQMNRIILYSAENLYIWCAEAHRETHILFIDHDSHLVRVLAMCAFQKRP